MLSTISNILFAVVMAGFASAAIYYFAKSSDKRERLSHALFAVALLLFAFGSFTPNNTAWPTYIGIILAIAAIIIRKRRDARRNWR